MTSWTLQMEDLYAGRWQPIGSAARIEADSPSAALALVESPGLNPGVTYRIRVTGPGVDVMTDPAAAPSIPALP